MIDSLKAVAAKAIGMFREEVSTVRTKLEAAKRRREDLLTSALSKADVVLLLHAHIDHEANLFPVDLSRAIALLHNRGDGAIHGLSLGEATPHAVGGRLMCVSEAGPMPDRTRYFEHAVFFTLRDQIRKAIAAAIEAIEDWPANVGPPLKERAVELAALEGEIKTLEGRMRELQEEHRRVADSFR